MPTIASANARNGRFPSTSRQSAGTEPPRRGSVPRAGSTSTWATVRTAKIPAAVSAEVRKSTSSSALPSSGPTSAPAAANMVNRANASALRPSASCAM
ncbi:hypothetical protein RKD35_006665 [Streptomyces albogriseolus]